MLGWPPRGAVAAALGVLAAGFAAAAGEWVWNLPAVFGPVIVAAALLTGPATLPALAPRVAPPMAFIRTRRRFAGGVAVLLVAWVAICAAGLLLLAQRALDDSEEAFFRADAEDALAQAAEANQLEPWAAEPYLYMAQVYRATGDIPAAQEAIGEALERAPQQWRTWVTAAQLDIRANDLAGARLNFDRAYELAPNLRQGSERYFRRLVEQE
jgi:tetratricopeptide (TPR) repeat protein